MDSFEKLNDYMKKEMGSSVLTKQSKEARRLIAKVQLADGKNYREKAKNCGISYEEYMKAQRIVSNRVS